MPEINQNYSIDDFYWDYWAFDKYTADEYHTVMHQYGHKYRRKPPDTEIIWQQKTRSQQNDTSADSPPSAPPTQELQISKLGQLPKNFQNTEE